MPKLCNNMYNNYYGEEFDYYYPYSFHNEDVSYLFSINPCRVEIPLGNNYQIPLVMDNYILVTEEDIVYYISGETPTTTTEAKVGARAYNVVDLISWELVSIIEREEIEGETSLFYNWEQDDIFTFYETSDLVIELPEEYYTGKTFNVSFYNFRYEPICNFFQEAHKNTHFDLTLDIANEYFYQKGLYYLKVDLIANNDITTVIMPDKFVVAIT